MSQVMTLSLRQRILWWSVGSSLIILLAVFLLVDEVFRDTILTDQHENLISGTRLAGQLQESELNESLDRMVGVATTPTLRAAVETGDATTIRQSLDDLIETSGMDWLAVATPEGELLAVTEGVPGRVTSTGGLVEETGEYDTGDLWSEEGRLIQVYATGVFVGSTHIAALIGGMAIGPERVGRLESTTQQRIAFVSGDRLVAGGGELSGPESADLASAWPASLSDRGDLAEEPRREHSEVREFTVGNHRFLGAAVALPDARGRTVGQLVVFRSLDEAMRPAESLRTALLVILLVAIAVAFVASYLFARRVVRPVNRLLDETVRLGSGNLDRTIEPERNDEIGRLAHGFEQMRVSLRQAQEELLRAERLSAVGRAASAIVHDFRQPIMVIQGYVEMIKADLGDRLQCEEDLRLIENELARLNSMMTEILDYARGGEGIDVTEGALGDLLEEVARPVRHLLLEKGISLEVEHGYAGRWSLDFPRTRRALENLVRNASSVVKPGGSVRLRSDTTESGLRLVVEDTGPGIPEEIRETIFEPFVTHGKVEGTGLGLAIVKAFTERQGGSVQFETSSAGTRFLLDFPARGAA